MIMRRVAGWIIIVVLCCLVVAVATTSAGYPLYPRGKMRLLDETRGDLAIQFSYPQFGRDTVDASITNFRDDLITGVAEGEAGHDGENAVLQVGYRVVYRSWRVASVVFSVSIGSAAVQSATTGNASPNVSYVVARTYDLWNDRVLTLDDVAGHPDAVNDVFTAVVLSLKDIEGVEQSLASRNVGASDESLGNWVVDGTDIIVYLNPGQVAPRSRGVIEVRVPLAAIQ